MTRLGQVGHVMMKDFREARWPLTVYFGIVALATAHAVGLRGADGEIFGYTMMLVVLFGMIVIGSIVQGDSPIRTDAFWATRPLYPSAVLLAKFAIALFVVIGVAEIGELAGLLAHYVPARDLARSLTTSMAEYGRWLLIAMIFAAITRDPRTFLLTLVAIPAYYLVRALAYSAQDFQAPGPVHHAAASVMHVITPIAFAGGGVMLLSYLYRARDVRPRVWVAAIVVFIAGMTVFSAPMVTEVVDVEEMPDGTTVTRQPEVVPERPERIEEAPSSVRHPAITLRPVLFGAGVRRGDEPRVDLRLDVDSFPATERLTLIGAVAGYHMRDGTVLRERVDGTWDPAQFGIHPPTATTWLDARDPHPMMDVTMFLSDSLREALDTQLTSLTLDGRVLVMVPAFADTIPLLVGATTAHGGERTTVTTLSYGSGRATLTLSTSEVLLDDSHDRQSLLRSTSPGRVDYSLVNEARREAIALESRGTGYQSGWLVLPGAATRTGSTQLEIARRRSGSASRVDDAWFRDARVVITHWVSRGSYPVHSEVAVPSTGAAKEN